MTPKLKRIINSHMVRGVWHGPVDESGNPYVGYCGKKHTVTHIVGSVNTTEDLNEINTEPDTSGTDTDTSGRDSQESE